MEMVDMKSRISDKRSGKAREQAIIEYLPLVKRIANRIAIYLPPTIEVEDLINVGVIGLIQALDRYDSTRDIKLSTYATFRIRGAMLSELRSRDFLSRANRKKIRDMEKAYLKLERKYGRKVDDEEVAEELGMDLEQFYAVKKIAGISFISLEELGYSAREKKKQFAENIIFSNSDDPLTFTTLKEIAGAIGSAIEKLPEKEQLVLSLYYKDELTMKETGSVLNLTESRVSQLHSNAIVHLRLHLKKGGYIN